MEADPMWGRTTPDHAPLWGPGRSEELNLSLHSRDKRENSLGSRTAHTSV